MSSKLYHYVYKITNTVNHKYYIGMRSTNLEPLQDRYMGSGTLIKRSVEKYGIESFNKEILQEFQTREEASILEEQLVTRETLEDPLCLNLKTGGDLGVSFYMPMLKERIGAKNPNFGNTKVMDKDKREKIRLAMIASPLFHASRKSEEYRKKISDVQSKTVIVFNQDFEILYSFKNCRVTAEYFGVTRANISNAIRDKRLIGKKIKTLEGKCYVCYEQNFELYKQEIQNSKVLEISLEPCT